MQFAHVRVGSQGLEKEPLEAHLELVANGDAATLGAARFAAAFGAGEWGHIAGLWHDLGKYSREFQEYLEVASQAESDRHSLRKRRVDHSTAGAQHAAKRCRGISGRVLAYCIAGHHAGLPDENAPSGQSGLADRLQKTGLPDYSDAPKQLLNHAPPTELRLNWHPDAARRPFQLSVFCRLLYSCLVDADYLATEAFMRPERTGRRGCEVVTPAELLPHVDAHLLRLSQQAADTPVNRARAGVLAQCREKAELPPGLFSLTVPTGGGKTLSSLAFALRHAVRHGLRRVIYAIPFTSIIEQNADVFRKVLEPAGEQVILEHHSNFEPPEQEKNADLELQTPWHRLAAENWDAPLVVTTNVQLFESLFANRSSRCRKLHNVAGSVVILDECQTLPVTLLEPTLRMLDELCRNYGCTVVLCSATQPAVQARPGFRIGLENVREIVADPPRLYETLRRVDVEQLGKLEDAAIVERLCEHEQVLCVVNTRGHAARLYGAIRDAVDEPESVFHLSAQMCAAHRTDVLERIRARLDSASPQACRVISTQLIEAGVDVDFPVVFRALAGLDSIAQAAGRCNREGRRARGQVYVFKTSVDPTHETKRAAEIAAEISGEHADLLSLDALDHFFRLSYWSRSGEWDREGIVGCFRVGSAGPCFQFREAAERYRLIRDTQQPVIVPYGARGRTLVAELHRMTEPPGGDFDGRAQRYVVGLCDKQFNALCENQVIAQVHERFWVLEREGDYDQKLGLVSGGAGFDPEQLCM